MAKVKIQGHASGTGVLTVTAPNTSTDRTITLPDGTGTLALTTGDDDKLPLAGGTMTNTLTIQNNVSSNTDPSLILSGTSNASQDSYMQMGAMFTSNPVAMGLDNSSNLFKIARNSTGNISSGEHLVINSSGVVSVPNGIELGSGIDATASNTLDDYEEGTWSPTWTSQGGTLNTNTSYSSATYTKIGNLVTVAGRLYTNSVSSPTGLITVSGLPFTVGSGANKSPKFLFPVFELNSDIDHVPLATLIGNSTTLTVAEYGFNGSGTGFAQRLDNDAWALFTFSYFI